MHSKPSTANLHLIYIIMQNTCLQCIFYLKHGRFVFCRIYNKIEKRTWVYNSYYTFLQIKITSHFSYSTLIHFNIENIDINIHIFKFCFQNLRLWKLVSTFTTIITLRRHWRLRDSFLNVGVSFSWHFCFILDSICLH